MAAQRKNKNEDSLQDNFYLFIYFFKTVTGKLQPGSYIGPQGFLIWPAELEEIIIIVSESYNSCITAGIHCFKESFE